jgi:hypothetical protein
MPSDTVVTDGVRNLDRLVARFWTGPAETQSVMVTTGQLPATHVVAEEYVVLPDAARARYLVPAGAPAAVRSAFTSHLSTVSPRSRLVGRMIAAGFRSGAAPRVFRDRLLVGVDRRIPRDRWREHLVLSELSAQLGDDLVAIHPVRRFTPNAKPTARLFTRAGLARGYAKLGWSQPTSALVRNETAALHALDGGVTGLRVPRPLVSGRWEGDSGLGLEYLVTTALPPGLRPWTQRPEEQSDVLRRIAASGEVATARLGCSTYLGTLRRRIEQARTAQPTEADALAGWLTRLENEEHELQFGRWHGDWVSWNLALSSGTASAWDWEYSAVSAPVGFDLLHWHFQHRLAAPGGSLDTAAAELAERIPGLATVGVPEPARRFVADLYLLEMLTRATGLAAEGSGWNPKLHPRLVTFAREQASMTKG